MVMFGMALGITLLFLRWDSRPPAELGLDLSWRRTGELLAGFGGGAGGSGQRQQQGCAQRANSRGLRHAAPRQDAHFIRDTKKKSAAHGGSRLRRQEANTGEELFADLYEV